MTARHGSPMTTRTRKTLFRCATLGAVLIPLGLLFAASPDRIEKTVDTTPKPRIGVVNFSGHIIVKGWSKSQIHAVIVTHSPQVRVETDQLPPTGLAEGIHFMTRANDPAAAGENRSADYTLEVPLDSSVEIRNPEGSVQIERLQGEASVESVGGFISISDVAGHLAAGSVEGNIDILRSGGRVEATSICGNLHIVSPKGSPVKAQTTSGKITYEGDLISGSEYTFTNYSGETDVIIPANASFELRKNTVRGHFFSDIPLPSRASSPSRYPAPDAFVGTDVSSTAMVQLRSFSGNIYIRRLH